MEAKGPNTILYVHGMGGGGDSRIPRLLREWFAQNRDACPTGEVSVVVRTYDFNPVVARSQIASWTDELRPVLVIGESLGACHAILAASRAGTPCFFVSPSLNAPLYLGSLCFLALIPGMRALLKRIYKVREGDRQALDFKFSSLKGYLPLREAALDVVKKGSGEYFAFFGTRDHYRRSGIVSISTWERHFPAGSYSLYEGSHFMEEEYIYSLLIPKICGYLSGLTTKH